MLPETPSNVSTNPNSIFPIYNLKDLLLVIIPDENPTVEPGIYYYLDPEVLGTT